MQNDNKDEYYNWLGYDSEEDREMTRGAHKLYSKQVKFYSKDIIDDTNDYN